MPHVVKAIQRGDVKALRRMVADGLDLGPRRAEDGDLVTPLQVAVGEGHAALARLFLEHGADVDVATEDVPMTPLVLAILRHRPDLVRLLIEHGADVRRQITEDRLAPLHTASGEGDLEIVVSLLDAGADIDVRAVNDATPLHLAAQNGHSAVVDCLVKRGANTAAHDDEGCTPLHTAVIEGKPEIVEQLLTLGADPNAQDTRGQTPLHTAAEEGEIEAMRRLLAHGVDIEIEDDEKGWTPLQEAASEGQIAAVELLIEQGANLEARDFDGKTALEIAAEVIGGRVSLPTGHGHAEIVTLLKNRGSHFESTVANAVQYDDEALLIRLLAAGADPNAPGEGGEHPLLMAARLGREGAVARLLAAGVDADTRGRDNVTALHLAAEKGHPAVAERLSTGGASLEARRDGSGTDEGLGGMTPLTVATFWGKAAVVKLLLGAGADVGARDAAECTPLHRAVDGIAATRSSYAVERDNPEDQTEEIVNLLVQHGADLEARSKLGSTPLAEAAYMKYRLGVRALVAAGADVNARNSEGLTPLHAAAVGGDREIVELLLEKGADPLAADVHGCQPVHLTQSERILQLLAARGAALDSRNLAGETPLHKAALFDNVEMAEYLIAAGVDVNAERQDGATPLRIALQQASREEKGPQKMLHGLLQSFRGGRTIIDVLRQHGARE